MNNERTKGLTQELNKKDRRNAAWRWSLSAVTTLTTEPCKEPAMPGPWRKPCVKFIQMTMITWKQ